MGGSARTEEEQEVGVWARPRESEVGASLCLLSSGRGAVEAAPETTDYCLSLSLSLSASVDPVVAVGASATLKSPGFSVSAGAAGLVGALGVAVSRGLNQ